MPKTVSKQEDIKIALCLIVKGSDEEATVLDRCLDNVAPFVDGIFITRTHLPGKRPNDLIKKIALAHGAEVSEYEWNYNFSDARNFNFSQVPKEYDYIMWCDADDVFRGLEKLRPTIEDNPRVDTFGMWYLYDFDDHKNPTVVHKKTQVVRNDGCVTWQGALHEDFKENRATQSKFVEGIDRIHLSDEDRFGTAKVRNEEISKMETEDKPDDPRSYWNYGNSLYGVGKYKKAISVFKKFLDMSTSDDEKYIVLQRMAESAFRQQDHNKAEEFMFRAIGMKPDVPDAYLQLGYIYFEQKQYEKAEQYTLKGVMLPPQYHKMIVYNPRDYDYNPMMLLAKIYYHKNRPDLMKPMVDGCLKIHPKSDFLLNLKKDVDEEVERMSKAVKHVEKLKSFGDDKDKIKQYIEELDDDVASHPAITTIRNKHFVKTESSGKDLVYYCGETKHVWNPELFKTKGFGGSEEAVVNLSKEWAKKGWNVTVYNQCGEPMKIDGVQYKPYWEYNPADKQDVTIFWRSPRICDYDINSEKVYIDLHDVIPAGEFNEKRLNKIDKIFVKTKFHRSLFPNVPDEKFEIIPNGMDFELFDQEVEKDQYLMVNTSSPDRSMDVLPKLFKKVKERVPQAKCKWAYGWDVFDGAHGSDKFKMQWKRETDKEMEEAGIENLGRVTQKEAAKMYLEANILAYPTEFAEIDCITVKKAQACGCLPVTTDFGALAESVQYGDKIKSKKTKDTWAKDFQFHFGLEDEKAQDRWVDAVVKRLQTPIEDRTEMIGWTKRFEWPTIAEEWLSCIDK